MAAPRDLDTVKGDVNKIVRTFGRVPRDARVERRGGSPLSPKPQHDRDPR
jgi:hypothetical protein